MATSTQTVGKSIDAELARFRTMVERLMVKVADLEKRLKEMEAPQK